MAETLIFEMATPMKGTPPDVPLAAGIQLDELTEGDERPMFVTLQIGEAGARSRNDREYPREVEEKVVAAINEQRVGGIRGHLRDDQRGTAHPEMVWRWVGAMMDEQGKVWGKAYVLPTQAQAREEIRTAMAANARIGTSRYATGTIDDEGMVEADTYQLEGIDYVHEARVGIPVTSVVPRITSESANEEAAERLMQAVKASLQGRNAITVSSEPTDVELVMDDSGKFYVKEAASDELSVGDFVSWNSSGGRAQGQIERIERNGTINVPDSSFTVNGDEDDPAALIQVYDGSRETDTRVGHKFSTLTKIQMPRGGEMGSYKDKSKKKETAVMPDENTFSLAEVQERVTEARKDDRAEIMRLNKELSEAQNKLADYTPVIESLGNPKYPDVALRAKLAELENLRRENEQLLQGYIEGQVAENVKSEAVRPMVTTLIKGEGPSTRAEVDNAVAAVLGRPEVKALLKAQTAAEMGPKLTPEKSEPGDEMPETTPSADATTVAEMMWS